jgi:hypothetical protein
MSNLRINQWIDQNVVKPAQKRLISGLGMVLAGAAVVLKIEQAAGSDKDRTSGQLARDLWDRLGAMKRTSTQVTGFEALPLKIKIALVLADVARQQAQKAIEASQSTDIVPAFVKDVAQAVLNRYDDTVSRAKNLPDVGLSLLADFIGNTSPDAIGFEEAKKRLREYGAYDKREIVHLVALVQTPDALGAILRGHVFVEGCLEQLIQNYLSTEVNLFRDLGMYFSQKVVLARALGLISDVEVIFLRRLNKVRNNLAHAESKNKKPRFLFDATEERQLWMDFVQTFGGNWPVYSGDKFPQHLKFILLYSIFDSAHALQT